MEETFEFSVEQECSVLYVGTIEITAASYEDAIKIVSNMPKETIDSMTQNWEQNLDCFIPNISTTKIVDKDGNEIIKPKKDQKQYQKEYHKKYREIHRDVLNERSHLYAETHREELKQKSKIYREKNKEKLREYDKKRWPKRKEQRRLKRESK